MSFDHLDLAATMEGIGAAAKSVLVHLSQPACEVCGLTWAGVPWLERKTGLGRTTVKTALEALVRDGHLRIHAYPRGGRGRSTEYVVLPAVMELSTAPCGKCRARMKSGRVATGIDESGTEKEAATRPVSAKPATSSPQNRPPGDPQSVIESQSVTALSRRTTADPPASPPGSATPTPSEPPPPRTPQEALRRVAELTSGIGAGPREVPRTVKDGPSNDE